MRKLFSLMLIAVGLLISGQAKAAVIEVNGTTKTLVDAFNEAQSGDEIKLTGPISSMASNIVINDGRVLTLNLNGNNINIPEYTMFVIDHGQLEFAGKGQIQFTVSYSNYIGKSRTGQKNNKFIAMYGSTDPNEQYGYSKFTLGKDVTLLASHYGDKTWNADYQYGVNINSNSDGSAYGVQVDISGTIKAWNGYAAGTLGSISKTTGNVPVINIYESAYLCTSQEDNVGDGCTGIMANGYAKWNIYGYVEGGVALYVKSGDVNLDNAVIVATGSSYKQPVPNGDGSSGNGSAIVYDTHGSYPGFMSLTITGNTVVSSENGYAIEEHITQGTQSAVENITIESGTFSGSEKGCINTTDEIKQQIKNNGTITGGTFSSEEIKDYVGNIDGVIDVQAGDETKYVVNGMPSGKTWVPTIAAAGATDFVKIAADEVVAADKTIAYLNIPGAYKVTVKTGAKLSVGEIVLSADAVIEVEAGGKLVVNGTNGLIAFETTNLVIKADATNGMGTFILNPAVKANKSPWATVEYMCSPNAGKLTIGSKTAYYWDIISSPFAEMTSITTTGQSSYYQRVVNQAYVNVTDKQQIYDNVKAFDALAICPNADRGSITYTIVGKLQGANSLANYAVVSGFNHMGNAYTAKMNAKELITELQQNNGSIRTLIYIWSVESQKYIVYTGYEIQTLGNINPMKSVFLYSDGEGTANLDYEKLIWNVNK